jgi:hypothetical protein
VALGLSVERSASGRSRIGPIASLIQFGGQARGFRRAYSLEDHQGLLQPLRTLIRLAEAQIASAEAG